MPKKTKPLTPVPNARYGFPEDLPESEQIRRMIETKKIFNHDSYMRIQAKDQEGGIKQYEVYIALFARLLTSPVFELKDAKTEKLNKYNTYPFWEAYKDGYNSGWNYFNDKFAISSDSLYSKNGPLLERTLHTHYYHTNHKSLKDGWQYWEKYVPLIFSIETLKEYGYYAGIIAGLNEYKRLHPILFSKFDKCNLKEGHEDRTSQTFPEIEELRNRNKENKFCKSMPLDHVINHFKILYEERGRNNKPYLTVEDFALFIRKAFQKEEISKKLKLNLDKGSKGKIIGLFYDFYLISFGDYEESSQVRDKYIHLLTDNFDAWSFSQVKQNFKSATHKL